MARRRYRKEVREAIVNATLKLLEQKSFEELKIEEIMALSGFTKGTFYQYFDKKEGLWRYMVEMASNRFRMMLTTAQEEAHTPREAIDMLLKLQEKDLECWGMLMHIFAKAVVDDKMLRRRLLDRLFAFIMMFGGKATQAKAMLLLGTFISIWVEGEVPKDVREVLYNALFTHKSAI